MTLYDETWARHQTLHPGEPFDLGPTGLLGLSWYGEVMGARAYTDEELAAMQGAHRAMTGLRLHFDRRSRPPERWIKDNRLRAGSAELAALVTAYPDT